MTLEADLHASFRTQPGWVHDGATDLRGISARRLRSCNVTGARAVTALAVDALRKIARKNRFASRRVVSFRNLGVCIVAKDALVGNQPARRGMQGIESGTHGPVAALFRIPGERHLDQRSARRAMQVRT